MDKIKIVTGIIFVLFSAGLSTLAFIVKQYFILIYAAILLIIGIFLLVDYGKEEHIEPIRKINNNKAKK